MRNLHRVVRFAAVFIVCVTLTSVARGGAVNDDLSAGRFDPLVKAREGGVIGVRAVPLEELGVADPLRSRWSAVAGERGGQWRVWLDARIALPTLALIRDGERWVEEGVSARNELNEAPERAAQFVLQYAGEPGPGETVELDTEASGRRGAHIQLVRMRQVVGGVPVEGAWFDFQLSRGKLVALGARKWAPVLVDPQPGVDAVEARRLLDRYVRSSPADEVEDLATPELLLLPVDAGPAGIRHRLLWRFRFTDGDRIATWTGEVDAHSGEITAFYDDTRYDRIQGHVNPYSDNGICAEGGCPEPGYPLPFADYRVDGGAVEFAGQHGLYSCSPGSSVETTLAGRYFRINDQCGPVTATATCGDSLDLGVADDINCGVASGASAGNTDAARSAYYTLNTVNRKARFWMPGNTWLEDTQTECRTNAGGGCNASYGSGIINMQMSSNGCGNTGQLQGLVVHEWGHGLDDFDGGGSDNPGEAYADIVAILEGRDSCIAPGFRIAETCSGYGDTCLTCMGLREMDWDARQSHSPATPAGFLAGFCPNGSGPCGKEIHCESHVSSEAIYDLATRDLPAMGVDVDSAWQLAERLWYQSRPGSGGDAYNCTGTVSDGCAVNSWYHTLRLQDDDDGDLSNGTPHAAAIFAAFDRHAIACGSASDAENQNSTSCAPLEAPLLTFTALSDAVELQWTAVPGAGSYRIHRNEAGCNRAQFPIAEVGAGTTSYTDQGLANGVPVYYRIQTVGANPVCESPVSPCSEAAAQQLAGSVRFDRSAYACGGQVGLEVTDLNHPTSSMEVTVASSSEPAAETVTLTETSPGSARFVGMIAATSAPASADGLLSIADGDSLTAEYVDLDDGDGGSGIVRQAVALADCSGPQHVSVTVTAITDTDAVVEWTTSEPTTSIFEWGATPALGSSVARNVPATSHQVALGPFSPCERVHFRIVSTDGVGNAAVADAQGAPFGFNLSMIQGVFHEDGFETDTGWTLETDWEIAPPQGLGAAPGDPMAAWEGSQVLGQDLSGQGSNPGDYEFNTTFAATSPVIDASAQTSVELRFQRWLNYEQSGNAYLDVKDSSGLWRSVWVGSGGLSAASWTERSYDITTHAAGNAALQIRFRQAARFGIDAGWNIDQLLLRDSSLPLHGACGGCTGEPSFAGASSATDDDPCAQSGITVRWAPAVAWGSGNGGTFSVYRGDTPDFAPTPAQLVATGVAGAEWTDTTAPADLLQYYLVRAENDEVCGSGANNGGLTDANLVRVAATDATGPPPAGPVGDTLLVAPSGPDDLRLSWQAVNDAAGYEVERSLQPDSGFAIVAQPTMAEYDDPGALTDGQSWYYRINASNGCVGGNP